MRIALFALLVFTGFVAPLTSIQAQKSQKRPEAAPPDPFAFERRVLALTNALREKENLPPLKWNTKLGESARFLAEEMGKNNRFEHVDLKGRNIDPRLAEFGYKDFEAIGENIAAGQTTPELVVNEWIHSPKHKRNIYSKDFTEIGIGFAFIKGSEFKRYWVQDFGARFDTFPVIVNRDEPIALTDEVPVYIHGSDWAKEMRLSEDGMKWSDWTAYESRRKWKFSPSPGPKTLYVELRKGEKTISCQCSVECIAAKPDQQAEKLKEDKTATSSSGAKQ